MRFQHQPHVAVQENNFQQRLTAWNFFRPFYFATNKMNYASYGSYYLQSMKSIHILYPGLKKILENNCLSVQSQDRYNVRRTIDQRGEQTLNRDARTIGGIRGFASDESSVKKWTMNRSEQATNTGELLEMCDIDISSEMYRPSRPSQILHSETRVADITRVLREEYVNPLDINLDKTALFNLSSGVAVPDEIAEVLLSLPKKGAEIFKEFNEKSLITGEISFNDPIKKQSDKKLVKNKTIKTVKQSNTSPLKQIQIFWESFCHTQ